ncbi:unnamed protein product [Protopolystoma xenopodis]|uniref:Uncharacterized protein n=1 Tax=Protopolystoma xenopodis TaxID=117903 RepID=A0A448XI29_9PLAT|nr:unnamed protein product [Protopolystoma xenopodis]
MVLRQAMLTDNVVYDAGKAPGSVPRPLSDFGNYHAYNGLRTRFLVRNPNKKQDRLPRFDRITADCTGNVNRIEFSELGIGMRVRGQQRLSKRLASIKTAAKVTAGLISTGWPAVGMKYEKP